MTVSSHMKQSFYRSSPNVSVSHFSLVLRTSGPLHGLESWVGVPVSVEGAASCNGREQSRCSWLESSAWVQGRSHAEVDVLTLSFPGLVKCSVPSLVLSGEGRAVLVLDHLLLPLQRSWRGGRFRGRFRRCEPRCSSALVRVCNRSPNTAEEGSLDRGFRIRWEMSSLVLMMSCCLYCFWLEVCQALQVKN
ncbi:hypothetical protein J6590_076255 [Homalodisca vitripennis]|nr:hypothetical protein J6590_076255 [Homalodisca vitripennis]